MAAESGVNVLLKVGDGGSPTLFTTVAGQQNTTFDGTTETADITDKANAGWGSTISTLIRGTIQCSGVAVWPDTAGLDQVRTSWQGIGFEIAADELQPRRDSCCREMTLCQRNYMREIEERRLCLLLLFVECERPGT